MSGNGSVGSGPLGPGSDKVSSRVIVSENELGMLFDYPDGALANRFRNGCGPSAR